MKLIVQKKKKYNYKYFSNISRFLTKCIVAECHEKIKLAAFLHLRIWSREVFLGDLTSQSLQRLATNTRGADGGGGGNQGPGVKASACSQPLMQPARESKRVKGAFRFQWPFLPEWLFGSSLVLSIMAYLRTVCIEFWDVNRNIWCIYISKMSF